MVYTRVSSCSLFYFVREDVTRTNVCAHLCNVLGSFLHTIQNGSHVCYLFNFVCDQLQWKCSSQFPVSGSCWIQCGLQRTTTPRHPPQTPSRSPLITYTWTCLHSGSIYRLSLLPSLISYVYVLCLLLQLMPSHLFVESFWFSHLFIAWPLPESSLCLWIHLCFVCYF